MRYFSCFTQAVSEHALLVPYVPTQNRHYCCYTFRLNVVFKGEKLLQILSLRSKTSETSSFNYSTHPDQKTLSIQAIKELTTCPTNSTECRHNRKSSIVTRWWMNTAWCSLGLIRHARLSWWKIIVFAQTEQLQANLSNLLVGWLHLF